MRVRIRLLTPFLSITLLALSLGSLGASGCIGATEQKTSPPASQAGAPPLDREIFPINGMTSFLTANERELLSAGTSDPGYTHGQNGRATLDENSDGAGAGTPPSTPSTPPPSTEPQPDPTREIVEADVFKLEGNLLYVLNRYRGLVIIDVSNPDKMFIRGRLPFQAMPVEMYVRNGRAYVVSSDYFVYWQYDPEADPHGFHGSQVMIADVSNPDQPKKLGTLKVDGEVTDTRLVGDVIYTVSKRRADYWRYNTADWEDRTWVASLNIADPKNIKEIDRITFSGTSTLIHVAPHAIFVAAWDPNYYLTSPSLEQQTLVTYVDISDPVGTLRKRGTVYIPGQIADKFKMNWHDGYLRVLSQEWRSGDSVKLHTISTHYPDTLKIDKTLDLQGIKKRGLQATRFDGDRAFAFTGYYTYPSYIRQLHTIDLKKPLQPTIAGVLNVDIDTSHVEVHGDRILVLGRHYIKHQDTRVAVALFDISNLAAPSQLALERLGEGYSSSEASHDYKAFKSFPKLNLLLVPLRYYKKYNQSFNGVQLVDWTRNTLKERGRVENTGGVKRAFPVGNRIVAVGEMAIATIDAQDRDKPVITRQLKVVHHVNDVFDVNGYEIQLVTDVYSGQIRFEVRRFGPKDDGPTLATLNLPYTGVPFVLRDGAVFHMFGREPTVGQVVRTADFSDPQHPILRGKLILTDAEWSVFHPGWGWYQHYWSPKAGLPLRNQIVSATFRKVVEGKDGRREWKSELRFLDLRDPDNPRIAAGKVSMNDFPFVNKVTHGNILYSTHVEQATSSDGSSLLYHVKSFVDRVDVTDPDHPKVLPSVNIPGYLVDVSKDGSLWYTVDYQWDDFGRRRNSINVLKLIAPNTASLITVVPVADQINRALQPGQLSEKGGQPTGWDDRTI
ncbi:MAG: beta-propeller domain-containing protein [Deltaproteobacteria bacterium]|nr:beta-propeller domain-containing protein [Deltaproteobacteria bacterium]